jgi:hypothetical protein
MNTAFEMLTDLELIGILERRGYAVRHGSDASRPLTWNRMEPFPEGLDFKQEALAKIREAVTEDVVEFTTRTVPGELGGTVHVATLRIL